jgi:peroxiredoxin
MGYGRKIVILLALVILAGCGGMMDDLNPSGNDKRSGAQPKAADFTIPDTLGNDVNLYSELTGTGVKGVLLYFTMWCDLCDEDLGRLNAWVIPQHPDVEFFAVDYVSGSVGQALSLQTSRGFSGANFRVLADIGGQVAASYGGTMGVTVVIDKNGIIRLNEEFKDGLRVNAALAALP